MAFENKTAILKFGAEWCPPCHAIKDSVHKAAADAGIELIEVDVDEQSDLAVQYGVRSVPMVFGLKDGKVVDQVLGAQPARRFVEMAAKVKG